MEDVAIFGVVVGLGGAWLFRALLLRMLRVRHPAVFFSELGAPRLGQLAARSFFGPKWTLQWRFLRFVWRGEFLQLHDPIISSIGAASFICDIGTLGLLLILLSGVTK